MNKLILIGNGFDLAHGLPTSYNDFIDHFWSNLHSNYDSQKIVDADNRIINYLHDFDKEIVGLESLINILKKYARSEAYFFNQHEISISEKNQNHSLVLFEIKNGFFKKINQKKSIQNWVDIENEYYNELKKIVKKADGYINTDKDWIKQKKKEQVQELNKEFEEVKRLLENYLANEIEKQYDFNKIENPKEWAKISDILRPNFLTKRDVYLPEKLQKFTKEFSSIGDIEEIKNYAEEFLSKDDFKFFKSFLLSFNYTSTVFHYSTLINQDAGGMELCFSNYIHGVLKSNENKINFGFGDEIDKDYQEIENIGDNEYLKNFKSFQYLNTDKYDELLRYIDSEKFQVYILGHSCGLSDRVLLNTIFEHENCRSIKVYYYQNKEGRDNYTDIVQSISRHFKNKVSMRNKIVNKTLCSPLPQGVKFKKEEIES